MVARGVMTLGSLAEACCSWPGPTVETPWVFYLLWMLIGASSIAGVLSEPAALPSSRGLWTGGSRGIPALTLVGGFASTVLCR